MTPSEQLKESVLVLQQQILDKHPQLPVMLKQIRQLASDANAVTTLTEEEIGIIVSGMCMHQNTVITTQILKSKTKSLKSLSVLDL